MIVHYFDIEKQKIRCGEKSEAMTSFSKENVTCKKCLYSICKSIGHDDIVFFSNGFEPDTRCKRCNKDIG